MCPINFVSGPDIFSEQNSPTLLYPVDSSPQPHFSKKTHKWEWTLAYKREGDSKKDEKKKHVRDNNADPDSRLVLFFVRCLPALTASAHTLSRCEALTFKHLGPRVYYGPGRYFYFLLYLFLVSTMWQMLTNPSRASEGGSLNTASTALCAQKSENWGGGGGHARC